MKSSKSLGLWLDHKLIFNEHMKRRVAKVERMVSAVSGVLPDLERPKIMKRRMLNRVVKLVVTYA